MNTDASAPAATAARAILAGQVRHLLTLLAGAAIAHGIATEAQTGAIVPALAEALTGAAIAGVGMAWSWASARMKHSRWAAAWAALTADDPDQPTG